jgi:hypothetical protein
LELLRGKDDDEEEEGKKRVEDYKHVATALKKRSDVSI